MLCQLSYRGSLAAGSVAASGTDRGCSLAQPSRAPPRARWRRSSGAAAKLAPQLPLPQAQAAARSPVALADPLRARRARRARRAARAVGVQPAPSTRWCAHRAMQRVVEVLGGQLGQHGARSCVMCEHAREGAPLEPRAGIEHALRGGAAARDRDGPPARSCTVMPSLSFAYRQASCRSGESPASSSSALHRPETPPRDRRRARSRSARGRAGTARPPRAALEAGRVVGRVDTRGQRDDLDVEALLRRELHPAQRRGLAGGVAVEREPEPLGQAAELLQLLLGQRRAHARDDRLEARPGAARSRRCCPRRRTRDPPARSRRAPCRARRPPTPCGRAPTRACSRTSPSAGRRRRAGAPGSRARGPRASVSGKRRRREK